MAIDLVAALRLDDRFSKPMQRAMKAMDNAEKVSKKLAKSTEKVSSSTSKMSRNFDRGTSAISKSSKALTSLVGGVAAVAAAYGAASGAVKIFNATVGEAMKMEQSQVVIGAMFNDKKLAEQYMKMLDKVAIDSPLLDSQAMYANSGLYISRTKDVKVLEKMWKLTERLSAANPMEGVEGATFSMAELLSGDATSMVERFRIDRGFLNSIKNLSLDKQLDELDKFMEKIGYSEKLVADMGNTAIGKWTQVKERWQLIMRDIGEDSLGAVSDFLNKTLDRLEGEPMQKFAEFGGKAINSIVTGLSDSAIKMYDYLTKITSSPEFQKRTTLTGKIDFIVSDIADKLKAWYDDEGKKKIMDFGEEVTQLLIGVLNNSKGFFELGASLGASLGEGVLEGIKTSAKESELGRVVDFLFGAPSTLERANERIKSDYASRKTEQEKSRSSRYHGIDYVPKNNWKADLHKGEAVLPAQEAKAWREGKSGSSSVVSINVANMNVREDGDIEKVAYQLAKYIESAAMQNG
ncbi:hypothetical protein [Lysinibacillus telephonicus]|uniref:hypothetical protein n=1 Tax=Lysinibacillus telephonicus TaxID=1714840 RepID=UPI0037CDC2B2